MSDTTNFVFSHDLEQTRKFLETLTGEKDSVFTFQTFDDTDKKRKIFAKHFTGSLNRFADELVTYNKKGVGVFVTVNQCDGKGRKAQNVVALRSLFADKDDGDFPSDPPLPPAMLIQSKRGQHPYWPLIPGESISRFTQAQEALIKHFGTDPTVKDLPRVMRLPGFYHMKDPSDPFLVSIKQVVAKRFSIDEIMNVYGKSNRNEHPFEENELFESDRESGKDPFKVNGQVLKGYRRNYLFTLMGTLRGRGFAKDEVGDMLILENETVCSPPLEASEIAEIMNAFKPRSVREVLCYAPQTDFGNAERFRAKYAGHVLYVEKMGKWHVHDGRRYVEDSGALVAQLSKKLLRFSADIGKGIFDDDGNELKAHLKKSESLTKITSMLKLAQTEMPVNPLSLDSNPYFFNVLNGTIDLKNGSLLPHQKDHLITKLSEITFDPNSKCPRFMKFLNDVTGSSAEMINYLQRIVGYCLTGIAKEQCLWILFGLGANGKTTFIEIVKKLLGEYGQSADISTFTYKQSEQIRNDLARLFDARLVTSVEIQEGKLLDESVIKQVTGGDPVTCRFLFKEHFEYIPRWKLFMVVNHLPHINGTDHGIWRRIKTIPFSIQFTGEQQDKNMLQKLEAELPGILNWAIEGCLKWQKDGLQEPATICDHVNEYRTNEDLLEEFLIHATEKTPAFEENATALFKAFVDWQKELGQYVMSQKLFAQKLKIKGFEKRRGSGGRVFYIGLRLKPYGERSIL